MRRSWVLLFIVLWWGSLSWAQPVPRIPAPPDGAAGTPPPRMWVQAVNAFAEGLVEGADGERGERLTQSLPAGAAIRRFGQSDPQDRLSLRGEVAGATLIMARGYIAGPKTVATDLAEAMREADFVPESIRAEFLIDEPRVSKRANDTASQWVMTSLQPGVEQPVGVIVLWQERDSEGGSELQKGSLIFILIKGFEAVPNEFRISFVLYGDLKQIVR